MKDEALKQALNALKTKGEHHPRVYQAITDIEEALAKPAQEPCRHRIADIRNEVIKSGYMCMDCGALFSAYTAQPQRPWVGLTDIDIAMAFDGVPQAFNDKLKFGRAIEQALKEKNT